MVNLVVYESSLKYYVISVCKNISNQKFDTIEQIFSVLFVVINTQNKPGREV